MHVILMGAQGSGKGTQAELLGLRLHLDHLSTGSLFRAAIAAESPLGREIKAIYDRGELIPDAITVRLVEQRLGEIAAERAGGGDVGGALFDGFPRNRAQAEALDAALTSRAERINAVIELQVPRDVLIRRLSGRRVCKNGDATYHVDFAPPRVPNICDRCGGELIQRDDDKPEPIRRRLDLYFAQTEPLLAYYRDRGLLTEVDGDRPVDVVTNEIVGAIEQRVAAS